MTNVGGGLLSRGLFKDFDCDSLLSHFLHQSPVGHVADDTPELRPIIAHNTRPIDHNIVDSPIAGVMNKSEINGGVDLPSFQLGLDLRKSVFLPLAEIEHLFIRTVGDAASKCVAEKLDEQLDEFPSFVLRQRRPLRT